MTAQLIAIAATVILIVAAIGGAFAFGIHVGRVVTERARGALHGALEAQSREVLQSERRAARAEALLSEAQEPRDFWVEVSIDNFQFANTPLAEGCQTTVMIPKRNMESEAWVRISPRGRRRLLS